MSCNCIQHFRRYETFFFLSINKVIFKDKLRVLDLRVISINVNQVKQIVNFLLISVLDDFVSQINYVFHQPLKVFGIGLKFQIFRMNKSVTTF